MARCDSEAMCSILGCADKPAFFWWEPVEMLRKLLLTTSMHRRLVRAARSQMNRNYIATSVPESAFQLIQRILPLSPA